VDFIEWMSCKAHARDRWAERQRNNGMLACAWEAS
jgi:hypothetical protein